MCSLLACGLIYCEGVRADDVYQIDIPVGSAESTVKLLAKQTDHLTLFESSDVMRVTTNAVSGELTLPLALARLLDGTPLSYDLSTEGVIAIEIQAKASSSQESGGLVDQTKQKKPGLIGGIAQALVATLVGAVPAGVAVAEDEVPIIEEITVTAEKREQNIL